jgi:nucleotide-binding universal stress UspA family protein
MILICYDGSPDSRAAVERAAELFGDQPAMVLTVWEPFVGMATRSSLGIGLVPFTADPEQIDDASSRAAAETAAEGAELARGRGMTAEHKTVSQSSTTARAILGEAEAIDAGAIVMGSRGLTGVKSLLLGSVSHEVVQHADRAVVIVPSPEVAASRARAAQERGDT